jgi:alcohol dehydrogenase YqhD (iron-dependent ADH family)
MAAVAVGEGQLLEQAGGTVIDDGDVVAAGAMCEGTGDPTFADAGRPRDILPKNSPLRF